MATKYIYTTSESIDGVTLYTTSIGTQGEMMAAVDDPATNPEWAIAMELHGSTYRGRKASLRHFVQELLAGDKGGLSYGEVAMIEAFIIENAKRYGMVTELRNEGIIA